MDNQIIIKCKELVVSYRGYNALGPLSIEIPAKCKVTVLGPNGAGKSTFIKAVAGVIPYKGSITNNYEDCSYTAQRQEVDWRFPITCQGVVEMGLYKKVGWFRHLKPEDKQKASKALEKLNMGEELLGRPISELSVGQQQRVFLARAIVDEDSDLFMFDEPLAGVDIKTEGIIYKLFDGLIAQGKNVICVHHNLYDAAKHFDYGILINHQLIAVGPIKKVLSKKNLQQAYGTGIAIPEIK